jgi:protein-tyrosine phosphatase
MSTSGVGAQLQWNRSNQLKLHTPIRQTQKRPKRVEEKTEFICFLSHFHSLDRIMVRRARFVHTNREKEEESSDDEPAVDEEEEDETDEEETTKEITRSSSEKKVKSAKEKNKGPITISLKKVCKVTIIKFILHF